MNSWLCRPNIGLTTRQLKGTNAKGRGGKRLREKKEQCFILAFTYLVASMAQSEATTHDIVARLRRWHQLLLTCRTRVPMHVYTTWSQRAPHNTPFLYDLPKTSVFLETIVSAWGFPCSTTVDHLVSITQWTCLVCISYVVFQVAHTMLTRLWAVTCDQRGVNVYLYGGTLFHIVAFSWSLHVVFLVPVPSPSPLAADFLTNYILASVTAILCSSPKDILLWFYC